MEEDYCSKEVDIEVLKVKLDDLERRCELKEKALACVEAWQSKALSYAMAFGFIASLVGNFIASYVQLGD